MTTRWDAFDLPLLRAIFEADGSWTGGPGAAGPASEIATSLRLLRDDGLIVGQFVESPYVKGLSAVGRVDVTPEGLRRLGQWPKTEPDVDGLLATLDTAIKAEPQRRRRRRMRALRRSVAGFAQEFGAKVLAEYFARVYVPGGGSGH